MKDFPEIKNDNLYKFLAMVGVILFLSPIYSDNELLKQELELNRINFSIQNINNRLDAIKNASVNLIDDIIETDLDYFAELLKNNLSQLEDFSQTGIGDEEKLIRETDELNTSVMDYLNSNFRQYLDNIKNGLMNNRGEISIIRNEIEENNLKLNQIVIENKYINRRKMENTLTKIAGAIFFLFGILFWYFNIQRYEDKTKKIKIKYTHKINRTKTLRNR